MAANGAVTLGLRTGPVRLGSKAESSEVKTPPVILHAHGAHRANLG
jgi:hypothetical protein